MDEWPELEALARAVDAWDEWPESVCLASQEVIDAARVVVTNYREQKALIEHYRRTPVLTVSCPNGCGAQLPPGLSHPGCAAAADKARYRAAMGLPPLRAEDAPKPELDEYISHTSGWDTQVTHPGRRETCGTCPGLPTDDDGVKACMWLPVPDPDAGAYLDHQHQQRLAQAAGAAAADKALDDLGLTGD